MKQRFVNAFKKYIFDNMFILIILMVVLVTGIIFGSIATSRIDETQRNELFSYVNNFFNAKNINVTQIDLFQNIFINYAKYILVYWFLGVTVIGIPFIIILIGFNGFCIGFSVGFILKYFFNIKAILMVFYSILPQGLLLLPCVVVLSVSGIKFSMQLLKEKEIDTTKTNQIKLGLVKHIVLSVFLLGITGVSALVESLILKTIF